MPHSIAEGEKIKKESHNEHSLGAVKITTPENVCWWAFRTTTFRHETEDPLPDFSKSNETPYLVDPKKVGSSIGGMYLQQGFR